jgi:MFS family permease
VRELLKLSAYRRLLAAYALNELAWSIGSLALAVLVYRRTGSALGAASFFLCAQFVPAMLSPALVARIDRVVPRRVLPALYSIEALLFLALWLLVPHFALAPVLVLAFADGVIALTARSLVRAATVTVLGAVNLLRQGNALSNSVFSLCFMAGPAIGGIIVAQGSVRAALLANAWLFAAIALTLVSTTSLPPASATSRHRAGRLRAALRYARGVPAIRSLLGLQAIALVFFTISLPVEVVFAERTLHAHASGYGWLLCGWGGGAVVGAIVYARWSRAPSRALIGLGAGALGAGFVVMAAAPGLGVAIAGAALAGAGNGVESVAVRTALQEHVEPEWIAVITSLGESTEQGLPGLGIVIGGALATLAGPRAALAVAGAGALVTTALVWIVLRPGVLRETTLA